MTNSIEALSLVGLVDSEKIDIRTTALQILRWAYDNGVLATNSYYPGETIGTPTFGEPDASPTAIGILRSRQIKFLSINPEADKIYVFLKKASPTQKEQKELPTTCNGIKLEYHQGNSETISPNAIAEASSTCAIHCVEDRNFYTCGSSISVGNNREAGTLGCLVKDREGKILGLTNNHVSGACNYAPTGLPVIAPGVLDVCPENPPPFTLGTHARQLPMLVGDPSSVDHSSNSDAALFEITEPSRISSMQRRHYDTPSTVADMQPGMRIMKVGRTTGLTRGIILGEVIGAIAISYSATQYAFTGNVYFEGVFVAHGLGDIFSEGGDSGSLVVHEDADGKHHAVGIVVAGCVDNSAPGGKRTFLLPLRPILDRLAVNIVSGHNC